MAEEVLAGFELPEAEEDPTEFKPEVREQLLQLSAEGAAPSDDKLLAEYAIRDHEAEGAQMWGERLEFVRNEARALLTKHRDALLALSAELYRRGAMNAAEIKPFLPGD
jgi:hypothetical protein